MGERRCACGRFPLPVTCSCGHLEQSHDINGRGERTRCSVSSGPKGAPCGCRRFETTEETT